jgi:hypothetical protein
VDDTADVEKADEHYFDFGLLTFMGSLARGITISNVSLGDFCSLTQNFTFTLSHCTLHFRVCAELATHTIYWATVQRILNAASPDFPCVLCVVASTNIPSKRVVSSPSAKLKMRLETYLPDLVYSPVTFLLLNMELG